MQNAVDYIREICKERRIPISALENACGFANGYLNPKKLKKIPYDRAVKISNYLKVPVSKLLNLSVFGSDLENIISSESQRLGIPEDELIDEFLKRNPSDGVLPVNQETVSRYFDSIYGDKTKSGQKEKPPVEDERFLPLAERREALSKAGIHILLDADAKVTEEQLDDIISFIEIQQRRNGR